MIQHLHLRFRALHVICSNPVKIMGLVTVQTPREMVMSACVNLVFMALNVKMTIDHANQIPAGTMVRRAIFILTWKISILRIIVGYCNETSNTTFLCSCTMGWNGIYCQKKNDYCQNILCLNSGVCRSSLRNYSCECLGGSYSGRHCEITAQQITVYKIISKSFAYVAIIAIVCLAMFVIIMDVLKYCFGIDPARKAARRIPPKKKPQQGVIIRFTYVDAPTPLISNDSVSPDV